MKRLVANIRRGVFVLAVVGAAAPAVSYAGWGTALLNAVVSRSIATETPTASNSNETDLAAALSHAQQLEQLQQLMNTDVVAIATPSFPTPAATVSASTASVVPAVFSILSAVSQTSTDDAVDAEPTTEAVNAAEPTLLENISDLSEEGCSESDTKAAADEDTSASADTDTTSEVALAEPESEVTAVEEVPADAPSSEETVDAQATEVTADLVLEDIELAASATRVAGPSYRVKFRNQSEDSLDKFEVTIVASLDGVLDENAPKAVAKISSMLPNQPGDVILRLPSQALRMTDANGNVRPFTHLMIAVDTQNSVAELDEANNVALVERSALDE